MAGRLCRLATTATVRVIVDRGMDASGSVG